MCDDRDTMSDELSPSQAAARIGTTTRTVQRWIALGTLPARRVGGRWRVASDALVAFQAATGPTRAPVGAVRILFVANRGEIARRIRRTAERLDISVVVPPTDGPGALDLLDIGAVVAAALEARADALHPGFGFLAESAAFAEAVIAAGIRWVGPPAAAIRAMGDKAAARRLARELGVPVVPGFDDEAATDDELVAAARGIGFPLLVKPAAGGGGKGMRTVRDPAALAEALAAARREAIAAFGDGRLVLERLIEGPRHVEIQVLFDRHGAGVHLGERDCSVQRRHQKVLEESPAPAVDEATRGRLGEYALRLAAAVGYESAGTCEFLLADDGEAFFLEMNTRLQVEHPVTELVTGRDLVADQLRIAADEPLGLDQAGADAARARGGHAIEVRLYAEDADDGFLPATGVVERLRWPSGPGIRVDAGIDEGTVVGGRFDPMLAKVIAHGADRAEALTRLRDALDATVVLGLTTNLRFLRWLVRRPAVIDGEVRIDTLGAIWPQAAAADAMPDAPWNAAAVALAGTDGTVGWRLNSPARIRVEAEGEQRAVALTMGTDAPATQLVRVGDVVHVDVDGRSVAFRLAPSPDVDRAARAAAAHHTGGSTDVLAPMPGAVLAVHRSVGEVVEVGDPVVTLEAMKMEHVVAASLPGRLTEVRVRPGEQVVRGQLLAVVEP